MQFYFYGNEMKVQDVGGGIKRKVIAHGGDMMMVEATFEKEIDTKTHTHTHEQTTYVISGEFDFVVDGEIRCVKAGDSIYMPPNIEHGCVCKVVNSVLLDVFTPQRKDFITKGDDINE